MKRLNSLFMMLFVVVGITSAQDCTDDCVWPGDLNANGVANYLDFLALGFSYEATGPVRPNATTDWTPQEAEDWFGDLPVLDANFKHSDADGNGVVDLMDRFVIAVNYTQMNPNFVDFLGNEIEGNDLFVVPVDSFVSPGGSFLFDIHLGTMANPIADMYGIGFQMNLDTQFVENVTFDYSNSWLGVDEELLVHDKYSVDQDFLGMAQTRHDGTSVSGFGPIARVEIVITDVILGLQLDTTACIPFPVSFENVLGINENEEDQLITTRGDVMGLKHPSQLLSTTNETTPKNYNFKIFPNPNEGIVSITSSENFEEVLLYNQIGQLLWREVLTFSETDYRVNFSNLNLPKGLYFLSVGNSEKSAIQKLILE